ncbi:MAG TPA: hypothetical protein VFO65_11510 [Acidimicrobiales bacterium]|nr:hypothetical protein [Acidimicrobiales bacterium]
MPARPRARPASLPAVLVALALVVAACAEGGGDAPARRPRAVVGAAPDRTLAAGPARVVAAAGLASLDLSIDLDTGRGSGRAISVVLRRPEGVPVEVDYGEAFRGGAASSVDDPRVAGALPAELVGPGLQPGNPIAALELLRAVVDVEAYGGQALLGVATHRYSLHLDPSKVDGGEALGDEPVPAEVWIDREGRVRRLQLARDLSAHTTTTDRDGLLFVTTVDFLEFGTRRAG